MSSDTPSNHASTRRFLRKVRRIQQRRTMVPVQPTDFETSIQNIYISAAAAADDDDDDDARNNRTKSSASPSPTNLREALTTSFGTETDFDEALFAALRNDLASCGVEMESETGEDIIILSNTKKNRDTYAFGFARNVKAKRIFKKKTDIENMETSPVHDDRQTDASQRSECDHVSALFERNQESEQWEIKECFSVVELKMSNTSCEYKLIASSKMLQDGPMVQEVAYVLETTWHSICRSGLGGHVGDGFLPLAVVAAHRTGGSLESGRCHCAKGRLFLPVVCTGPFVVEPNFAEKFLSSSPAAAIEERAKKAVDVYFETLTFGYDLFQKWKPAGINVPSPVAAGKLTFPGVKFQTEPELCGSPLLSRTAAEERGFLYVSQGELYRLDDATLTFEMPRSTDLADSTWLIPTDKERSENGLLLKVWSASVHSALQPCESFCRAMMKLLYLAKTGNDYVGCAVEELSKVLFGICEGPVGTATLMRELQNATPLCLEEDPKMLLELWESIVTLAETVLLPLASVRIIHSDIRPGFDITANILLQEESSDGDGRRVQTARLVDYESLCFFSAYVYPDDERYLGTERVTSAYAFVEAQLVGIAYSWMNEIKASNFSMEDAMEWIRKEMNSPPPQSLDDFKPVMTWLTKQIKIHNEALKGKGEKRKAIDID